MSYSCNNQATCFSAWVTPLQCLQPGGGFTVPMRSRFSNQKREALRLQEGQLVLWLEELTRNVQCQDGDV